MASASDHRAHAALQPADCLILLPQRLPAAVETSIGPAHYPAECTQSDAFLQPSLRARNGRANSDSFPLRTPMNYTFRIKFNRGPSNTILTDASNIQLPAPEAGISLSLCATANKP